MILLAKSVGAVERVSWYDTKQSDSEVPVLGNAEYPFIAIAPTSAQALTGMDQIELKLCTYAKLKCTK